MRASHQLIRISSLALTVCSLSFATTYYVAINGSDAAAGTLAAPFQTIQKAAGMMAPGDTCKIRAGIYRESIVPGTSGAASRPIVFMAYPGDTVFINAADPITQWVKDTGPFWKAPMSWDLGKGRNQVFANGVAMYEARVPNVEDVKRTAADGNIARNAPISYVPAGLINPALVNTTSEKGAGILKIWVGAPTDGYGLVRMARFFDSCRTANAPQDFFAGANVHKTGGYWECFSGVGAPGWGIEPAGAAVCPGWMYVKVNAPNWEAGGGMFRFSGLRVFLDAQKEWILENGTLTFRPPGDVDPNTLLVEAKHRQLVMDLRNRDYIEVRGLRFLGGGVTMYKTNNCVVDKCNFRYINHWEMSHGYNMDYRYNGESAFYIEGNNNKIINSSIEYGAASGIYCTGINNLIDNNLVSDLDYLGGYDVGVCAGSTVAGTNWVTHNTIFNMGRSAYTCTPGSKMESLVCIVKLMYNNMYNCLFMSEDGGTFYTAGESGGAMEIGYNWFWNMIRTWNGHHIYFDMGGGYYTKIHHNVFWQDSSWMSENNALTTLPMRNVVWNNTSLQSPHSDVYKPFDDDERGVNALWANGQYAAWGIKDYPKRDFTLLPTSKAIDVGNFRADSQFLHLKDFPGYWPGRYLLDTPIVVPDSQVTGAKPDLGAYEYGKPAWGPPGHTWGTVVWNYPPGGIVAAAREFALPRELPRPFCQQVKRGLTIGATNTSSYSVQVLDMSGRTVLQRQVNDGRQLQISTVALPQSVLLVRVLAGSVAKTFRLSLVH